MSDIALLIAYELMALDPTLSFPQAMNLVTSKGLETWIEILKEGEEKQ